MERTYQQTHPWITFQYDPTYDRVSTRVGEAYSKCQHLAGTPLQPRVAQSLASVYLVKGAAATTAIEGNTLTEGEVDAIINHGKMLPPSQQYLQQEVLNIVGVLKGIQHTPADFRLTPDWLKTQNAAILAGLELADHVIPGEYTTTPLIVGTYRGAPPQDVPYLIDRLCEWVNARTEQGRVDDHPDIAFYNTVITAILAHLYIAWIHPFGDGNGRTARAIECAILTTSGLVPWVSSNLLSDHYNRTRSRYYDRLAASSRNRDVQGFVQYALDGFVDMLREQITTVQTQQRAVAWVNYVHEMFDHETHGDTSHRRRKLLLALPEAHPTPRAKIRRLTPELAELYAQKSDKTISHDLNRLVQLDLIAGDPKTGYLPRVQIMDAFLPESYRP
ncbi:MAG: Fic family protein [Propionibacteriaceae bacterium]|jgi:Fic family protein|nr:Fic family protein [Propionibacteriaceae bacterium]